MGPVHKLHRSLPGSRRSLGCGSRAIAGPAPGTAV